MGAGVLKEGSKLNGIILDIRERKGLKKETPDLSQYLDKL